MLKLEPRAGLLARTSNRHAPMCVMPG